MWTFQADLNIKGHTLTTSNAVSFMLLVLLFTAWYRVVGVQ